MDGMAGVIGWWNFRIVPVHIGRGRHARGPGVQDMRCRADRRRQQQKHQDEHVAQGRLREARKASGQIGPVSRICPCQSGAARGAPHLLAAAHPRSSSRGPQRDGGCNSGNGAPTAVGAPHSGFRNRYLVSLV